jgi:hypothetical protein
MQQNEEGSRRPATVSCTVCGLPKGAKDSWAGSGCSPDTLERERVVLKYGKFLYSEVQLW